MAAPTGWPSRTIWKSIVGAGGCDSTTPSLSASPNGNRCGDPGTSAPASLNVRRTRSLIDVDALDVVVVAAFLPPPHATSAAAPPATRNDRLDSRCDIGANLSSP